MTKIEAWDIIDDFYSCCDDADSIVSLLGILKFHVDHPEEKKERGQKND